MSHYRTHSAFEQGDGSTESVIKKCLVAFPSFWVSRNSMFGIALLKEAPSITSVCPLLPLGILILFSHRTFTLFRWLIVSPYEVNST